MQIFHGRGCQYAADFQRQHVDKDTLAKKLVQQRKRTGPIDILNDISRGGEFGYYAWNDIIV